MLQKRKNVGLGSTVSRDSEGKLNMSIDYFRAPVLVAIALIHYGSSPENAIALIRKARPGAINHSQAHFILNYKTKGSQCNIF